MTEEFDSDHDDSNWWKEWPPFGFLLGLSVMANFILVHIWIFSLIGYKLDLVNEYYKDISYFLMIRNVPILLALVFAILILNQLKKYPKFIAYLGGAATTVVTTLIANAISKYLGLT